MGRDWYVYKDVELKLGRKLDRSILAVKDSSGEYRETVLSSNVTFIKDAWVDKYGNVKARVFVSKPGKYLPEEETI